MNFSPYDPYYLEEETPQQFQIRMIRYVMIETGCDDIIHCQDALIDSDWDPNIAIRLIKNPEFWVIKSLERGMRI